MRRAFVLLLALAACKDKPMTTDEYGALTVSLFTGLVDEMLSTDGTCPHVATVIEHYTDEHMDDIQHIGAWKVAHPADAAAWQSGKGGALLAAQSDRAHALMLACFNDPAVQAAFHKMQN